MAARIPAESKRASALADGLSIDASSIADFSAAVKRILNASFVIIHGPSYSAVLMAGNM
jgi:hypothetical protein